MDANISPSDFVLNKQNVSSKHNENMLAISGPKWLLINISSYIDILLALLCGARNKLKKKKVGDCFEG